MARSPCCSTGCACRCALPPLAPAILRLVDGRRTVGEIAAALAATGTAAEAFARAWRATFAALERVNRLLLAAR